MKGRRERGTALVLGLATLVILTSVAGAFLSVELSRLETAVEQSERDRALPIAEAGIDTVGVLLNANAWGLNASLDWSADGLDNDGDGLVDEGDETLLATAEVWTNDGIDNDGDGAVDEEDEAVARVSSGAAIGVSRTRVTGWLRRSTPQLPLPVAAVYLHDPLADCTFQGNAFRIDGNDVHLNGTPGPSPPLLGVAINGEPGQVTSQLAFFQQNNVTGLGGWPSVGSNTAYAPDFIEATVEALAPEATLVFPDGSSGSTYTGSLGSPFGGNVAITYSNGDLKIGGGSTGAGVLLVDGDLEIAGAWDYVGYVFVTGRVVFRGGAGAKRLRGALFVGGDVQQGSLGGMLGVNGTVDLLYSSQALHFVRMALRRYRVTAVTEP